MGILEAATHTFRGASTSAHFEGSALSPYPAFADYDIQVSTLSINSHPH